MEAVSHQAPDDADARMARLQEKMKQELDLAEELSKSAPDYQEKANLLVLIPILATLILCPWPALLGWQYGWVAMMATPWITILVAIKWSNSVDSFLEKIYVEGIIKCFGSEDRPVSKSVAGLVWKKRHRNSNVLIILFSITWIYLMLCYGVQIFSRTQFGLAQWSTTLEYVARVVVFAVSAILTAVGAASLAGATKKEEFDFEQLLDVRSGSLLRLEDTEKNNLEIVGLDVNLAAIHRRVEAYTIESTLLSALAFSAFIGIVFSDRPPPLGRQIFDMLTMYCGPIRFSHSNIDICSPADIFRFIDDEPAVAISAFLLFCSVFFLAVLTTRIVFNDGYRYTEEVLRAAGALNQHEEVLVAERHPDRPAVTKEIDRMLHRARTGVSSLEPITGFMQLLRNVGILLFMGAIASCGMYYSWIATLAIVVIFLFASAFGVADKLRRHASMMPLLNSTILGGLRRRDDGK